MKAKDEQALIQERRESMIAEAAYFRAERRGFQDGDPVADWLEAEAEINAQVSSAGPGDETRSAKPTLEVAEKAQAEKRDVIEFAPRRPRTRGSPSSRRSAFKVVKQ
jgi:hypothetical protein